MKKWNSFLSQTALCVFLAFSAVLTYRCHIYNNYLETANNLKELDEQIYIEVLTMQRVKYAIEEMEYDETSVYYNDCRIDFQYGFTEVYVTYTFPDRSYSKYYVYDLESKSLHLEEYPGF